MSAYKLKFSKSLEIVLEYQNKLLEMAEENERMRNEKKEIKREQTSEDFEILLRSEVDRMKTEFVQRVNAVKNEGERATTNLAPPP